MAEHLLFLTGKLAEKSLNKVLAALNSDDFTFEVRQIGISVAGLMTTEMVKRRVSDVSGVNKMIVPGRIRGEVESLSDHYGIPVIKGPDELKDLPQFFGHGAKEVDLSKYDVQIFAEIVDAPQITVDAILNRAHYYKKSGANVIDLGCLPETPFPHLEDAIAALHDSGFLVSVDSLNIDELLRGGKAGADFLLSLNEESLWVADEVSSTPILIPQEPRDFDSLIRVIEAMRERGRSFIADPILEPIHYGFTESIARYQTLRKLYPEVEIMMGIGNLTELTDADTSGMNAILMGIVSELAIKNILTTEVSPHARRVVREIDAARRMFYAAREAESLPRNFSKALLCLHDRKPFPYTVSEINEFAQSVKDPSFRIQISEEGIHIYNRDGMQTSIDPFALYPELKVNDDADHAFYLGVELARAQVAWQLGKRYSQDEMLKWGCALEEQQEDTSAYCAPGTTLQMKKMDE